MRALSLISHPPLPSLSAPPSLSVAEAAAESTLDGGNMALAIFIPVLILSVLLGGAYVYITRCAPAPLERHCSWTVVV